MESFEKPRDDRKQMPLEIVKVSITNLEAEGWEYEWSFRTNIESQWDEACDIVDRLTTEGVYRVVVVRGDDEIDEADDVAYVYKRKK